MSAQVKDYPILQFDESEDPGKRAEIKETYNDCYNQAIESWGTWTTEADRDMAFYLGDQWTQQEKSELRAQKREPLVFNKIRRHVKIVEGYERKTRVSYVASPTESSDESLANDITKGLLWQYNKSNLYMTNSEAFAGGVKVGMNLVELEMDYIADPLNGNVISHRVAHNEVLLDPRFTKIDLSDCEYIIQRKFVSREVAKSLLPFREEEIDALPTGQTDEKFSHLIAPRNVGGKSKDYLRFDKFWLRKFRSVRVVINMETGEWFKWRGDLENLAIFLGANPQFEARKREEGYVELNIMVENQLMYSAPDPWGLDDFPHTPVICFYTPEYNTDNSTDNFAWKLQGLVRNLRDPQKETNKRRIKILDIVDSSLHGVWQAKESAVVDKTALYNSGNQGVIWLKRDAQMTDVLRLPPAEVPNALVGLTEKFDNDIQDISGISPELFGMPENANVQISGILSKVRQGAALTLLQDIIDNYRFSQKIVAKKVIKMMQKNYTESKWEQILGKKPDPKIKDTENTLFDIGVEEAIETQSQKQLYFLEMMQAKQMGMNVPDSVLLDAMPMHGKEKMVEAMKKQDEATVQQQKLEGEQRQVLNKMSEAKIQSDLAMAAERRAKIQSDLGLAKERVTEAQQNQSETVLNMVKAAVEIQNLDQDRKIQALEFIRQLQLDQQAKVEQQVQPQTTQQ